MEEEHLPGGCLLMGEIQVLVNDRQKLHPLHAKPKFMKMGIKIQDELSKAAEFPEFEVPK